MTAKAQEAARIALNITDASTTPVRSVARSKASGPAPWYKGGSDGKMAVWYVDDNADKHHPGTQWVIGFARHVGKMCSSIAATSSAVTPDAVQAGTWHVTLPWQPNSEVRSVSPDTALGLLMA